MAVPKLQSQFNTWRSMRINDSDRAFQNSFDTLLNSWNKAVLHQPPPHESRAKDAVNGTRTGILPLTASLAILTLIMLALAAIAFFSDLNHPTIDARVLEPPSSQDASSALIIKPVEIKIVVLNQTDNYRISKEDVELINRALNPKVTKW